MTTDKLRKIMFCRLMQYSTYHDTLLVFLKQTRAWFFSVSLQKFISKPVVKTLIVSLLHILAFSSYAVHFKQMFNDKRGLWKPGSVEQHTEEIHPHYKIAVEKYS